MKKLTFLLIFFILTGHVLAAAAKSDEYLNLKWSYAARERVNGIYVGDFNGDGKKEIAAIGSIEGSIYFIDPVKKNLTWKKSIFCPVYAINGVRWGRGDKYEDIIIGSCTHLHVFNSSGEQRWQFFTDHGAARVIFPADISGDGEKELLIGGGDPTSKIKNNLYLADRNGKLIWRKKLPAAPYSIDVGDINADGVKDIIVGTVSTGLGAGVFKGRVSVYNGSGALEWEARLKNGVYSVKIDDLDKDGNFEIIVGSFPEVYVFDKNGEKKWEYSTGAHVYSLAVIEIEKKKKLILGSNDVLTFDSTLKKEWGYNTEGETYVIRIVDLNMDGKDEILTGSDKLYALNSEGKLLYSSDNFVGVKGIFFEDLEGDGYNEVIVGAIDRNIYVFETKKFVMKKEAEENLKKAKEAYEDKNYENATNYAEKAKKLYQELKEKSKVRECDDLIKEIEAIQAEDVRNKKDADNYYNKSLNFYLEDKFKSALIFARKARIYYEAIKKKDIGVENSLEKVESLINNSITGLKLQAYSDYENSSVLYGMEDYKAALDAAREAETVYKWLNDTGMKKKADELMAKIFYSLAKKEYEKNDMKNASVHVQASLKKYLELGDNDTYREEIERCNALIEKISKGPKKGFLDELDIKLVGGALIILLSIFVVAWVILLLRRRKLVSGMREKEEEVRRRSLRGIEVREKTKKLEEEGEREKEKEIPEKKKKPKAPKLEPIKKDKFRGVGKSLKM